MKSKGLTLAEVLVTLCIIGVIAVIVLPVATHMKPDYTKIKYLKVYNTLSETIKNLASNSNIFPACEDSYCFEKNPLFNTSKGIGEEYPEGNGKLCKLLADSFNALENSCSDAYSEFDGEHFTFETQDGTQFYVSTFKQGPNADNSAQYRTDIWVDVNGAKAPNKLYGEDDCTTPDRFKFMISAAGKIVAADPMGEAYINTNKNWIKTNYEIADGAEIKSDLELDYRDFDVTPEDEVDEEDDIENNNEDDNNDAGNDNNNNGNDDEDVEVWVNVACGEVIAGKIVNCLNSEPLSGYSELKSKNSDVYRNSNFALPNMLFFPKREYFTYPVASNVYIQQRLPGIMIARECGSGYYADHRYFNWEDITTNSDSLKERFGITLKETVFGGDPVAVGACTVSVGKTDCNQSEFNITDAALSVKHGSINYGTLNSEIEKLKQSITSPTCSSPLFAQDKNSNPRYGMIWPRSDSKYWYVEAYNHDYAYMYWIFTELQKYTYEDKLPILLELLDKPYNKTAKEQYQKAIAQGKSVEIKYQSSYAFIH